LDKNLKIMLPKKAESIIKSLEKNNIQGIYAENKEEALKKIEKLLNYDETVAVGGSVSLFECGIIDHLRSGKYNFLDQYQQNLSKEEVGEINRNTFFADSYILSANAITIDGEIYNVDGNGNRVAAMIYGPKSVIVVIGYNKIVNNLDEAINRVKSIAAPANCERLTKDTYCRSRGECIGINKKMTNGCDSENRICRNYTVIARQPKFSDRIKVLIVGEELGY